jgi:putative ABC transport system substrate-binding protein
MSAFPRDDASFVALFDELRRSGFVEGQNLQVDGRFSIREEEASKIAAVLVAAGVDAIMTGGYPRARVVQKATLTIPVLIVADDLVLSRLVTSLGHPGGNTTGVSILATELDGKRQELLTLLVPGARHIAALADPRVIAPDSCKPWRSSAGARHRALDPPGVETRGDRRRNRRSPSFGRPSP